MSYGIGPVTGVVGQTSVPSGVAYPGTAYSSTQNIANGIPEAGALLARAQLMRGEASPAAGVINLGAQAPGMIPGNTLDYANGLENRRGYTPSYVITRDVDAQNLPSGIFAFHFVPDTDFGAEEDLVVKQRVFGDTVGDDAGEELLKSHESIRLKHQRLPVFNLSEVNAELFRRQFYREPSVEYATVAEFLRHNRLAVCGFVDTSATNAVVPTVTQAQRAVYGPKRVDLKIQGDAQRLFYHAFGNQGVAGKPCQFILLAIELSVEEQLRMCEATSQFVRQSAASYPYQYKNRVGNWHSGAAATVVRHRALDGNNAHAALTRGINRDISERQPSPYQRHMAAYKISGTRAAVAAPATTPRGPRYFYQLIGWPNMLNPMHDVDPDGLLMHRNDKTLRDFAVYSVAMPRNSFSTAGEPPVIPVARSPSNPVVFSATNVHKLWKIATTFEPAYVNPAVSEAEKQGFQFSLIDYCTRPMIIMPNGFHPRVYSEYETPDDAQRLPASAETADRQNAQRGRATASMM